MDMSMIRAVIKNLNLMPLITFIIGFFIGLVIFGWGLTPVNYVDGTPQDLRSVDYQQYYLRGLAGQYAQNEIDAAQARSAIDAQNWPDAGIAICDAVNRSASGSLDSNGNMIVLPNPRANNQLSKLVEVLGQGNCEQIQANAGAGIAAGGEAVIPADGESSGRGLAGWLTSLGWLLVLLLLVGAFWWFWNNNSNGFGYDDDESLFPVEAPGRKQKAAAVAGAGASSAPEMDYYESVEGSASASTVSNDDSEGGIIPISTYRTSYSYGQDSYDDSFSIENGNGEFLGECGVGISETVGSGGSRAVTALEVWLFDKNDIRTITKVAMSENTWMDEALKAKLEPKGEAVLAGEEEVIVLETASLIINARITELDYGSNPELPENSYFERLSIEMSAWAKNDGGGNDDDGFDFG